MKKTIIFALSATTLTAMLLAGCGSANTENDVYPQVGSAAGTQTSVQTSGQTSTAADYIGEDEAKKIALENAQQTEENVTNLQVYLDDDQDDDDPAAYEVEFFAGDNEYDYEIDAITGEILLQDVDKSKAVTTNTTTQSAQTSSEYIGEDKAKEIALENANQKEANVTNLQIYLDEDHDGNDPTVYDVEFYAGTTEYDYEIDAITGDVLSQGIEVTKTNASSSSSNYIGKTKAKKIALKDAGLKSSQVSGMRVVLDWDDDGHDPTVYDVEFYAGNTEYDYEIDAVSGEILSKDADAEHIDASAMSNSNSDLISETKAKKAALKHAGLKESEVERLTVKLDRDDGIYEYEVEFYVGRLEYSYEINAVNGEIVSYETDYDD